MHETTQCPPVGSDPVIVEKVPVPDVADVLFPSASSERAAQGPYEGGASPGAVPHPLAVRVTSVSATVPPVIAI